MSVATASRPRGSKTKDGKRERTRAAAPTSKQINQVADRLDKFRAPVTVAPGQQHLKPQQQLAVDRRVLIEQQINTPTTDGVDQIVAFTKPILGGVCNDCDPVVLVREALKVLGKRE